MWNAPNGPIAVSLSPGFKPVEIGRAGARATIAAARRSADADVETQLSIDARIAGHRIIAADQQPVAGTKAENALRLPYLGKRRIHRDFVERYLAVGGNVELQVVARLVIQSRRAGFAFENELLDERGDVLVAHHAEAIGGRGLDQSTVGRSEVEKNLAVVFAGSVGFQSNARRKTPRRTVGDVEASVVLGAFDQRARDKAVGQMGVAMRTQSVAGVKTAVGGAINGVGLAFVVEADDVFPPQEVAVANLDPAVHRAGPSR